jgi:hypothetical protein
MNNENLLPSINCPVCNGGGQVAPEQIELHLPEGEIEALFDEQMAGKQFNPTLRKALLEVFKKGLFVFTEQIKITNNRENVVRTKRDLQILRGALDTILFEAKEPIIKVYAQSALDETKNTPMLTEPPIHIEPENNCKEHNWFGLPFEKCPLCLLSHN